MWYWNENIVLLTFATVETHFLDVAKSESPQTNSGNRSRRPGPRWPPWTAWGTRTPEPGWRQRPSWCSSPNPSGKWWPDQSDSQAKKTLLVNKCPQWIQHIVLLVFLHVYLNLKLFIRNFHFICNIFNVLPFKLTFPNCFLGCQFKSIFLNDAHHEKDRFAQKELMSHFHLILNAKSVFLTEFFPHPPIQQI